MKFSCVQMKMVDGNVDENVKRAGDLLKDAPPADLYLLPELFTSGFDTDTWRDSALSVNEARQLMARLALGVSAAVCGSVLCRDERGSLRNRCFFTSKSGECLAFYDKVHLFTPMNEHKFIEAGDRVVVVDYMSCRFGLATCYDLRFPCLFYRMFLDGARVFLVGAQWPLVRKDLLLNLSRARAIECQCYMLMCNRSGEGSDGTVFAGSSIVCDSSGRGPQADEHVDQIIVAEYEPGRQDALRKLIPVKEHRVKGIDTL